MASQSAATYLSPGLFDMGGIARYGRYQVSALRRLISTRNMRVLSMLGPNETGFDEPFPVDFSAGGTSFLQKLRFVASAIQRHEPRRIFWAGHLNYAPLTHGCADAFGSRSVVNLYGLEVWSCRSALHQRACEQSFIVSDCHATLDIAVDMGMARREASAVIWDPVDLDTFYPAEPDPAVAERYGLQLDGRFRVMFLGRLAKAARHKSPDALIEAFAKADLGPQAELVIAGSGDRLEALKMLAEQTGKGQQIRFLGRIPDADLAPLYRLASLFVLVSKRYDGGGEGIPLTREERGWSCRLPATLRRRCVQVRSGAARQIS